MIWVVAKILPFRGYEYYCGTKDKKPLLLGIMSAKKYKSQKTALTRAKALNKNNDGLFIVRSYKKSLSSLWRDL